MKQEWTKTMNMRAFDAYSLKARYYPTVIVIAPGCLVVMAAATSSWTLLTSFGVALVSALGLAFLMDQVGRDQGKKKEPLLSGEADSLTGAGSTSRPIFRECL